MLWVAAPLVALFDLANVLALNRWWHPLGAGEIVLSLLAFIYIPFVGSAIAGAVASLSRFLARKNALGSGRESRL